MRSLGAADFLVLAMFVLLVLDSRRLRALARSTTGRTGREFVTEPGMPAGSDPDLVGITLRQIQLRRYVDSEDGGVGWDEDGPEILPAAEADEAAEAVEADEEDPGAEDDRFAFLGLRFDHLPAPVHRRPTVVLDWISPDLTRRPAKMLECSGSSSGTSTAP